MYNVRFGENTVVSIGPGIIIFYLLSVTTDSRIVTEL